MKRKTPKAKNQFGLARFRAIHGQARPEAPEGERWVDRTAVAGFEVTGTGEANDVELEVLFDEGAEAGAYRQSIKLQLDARGARELAYSLLLFANDLE